MKYYDFIKNDLKDKRVPKYVKLQLKELKKIADDKDDKWIISKKRVAQVEGILKLLIMPKGICQGQTFYECSISYQWYLYIACFCVYDRETNKKRKYETVLLEIGRKNYKTYTSAVLIIISFILSERFSNFYSVAPDGSLSRLVKSALSEILRSSRKLYYKKGNERRFLILRDYVKCFMNDSTYTPLNYSTSRLDGRLPNAFTVDEIGALPNNYAVEAMESGQVNVKNKLGILMSTKYPSIDNPIEDYSDYAKRILNGSVDNDHFFSLLYEPDDLKKWESNDTSLYQANPASISNPALWDSLLEKRQKAIDLESTRENFLTKHMNIIYSGLGTESFVDINALKKCKVDKIDWSGRDVYVGVDLAMTNDNCAVAIASVDDDNSIIADAVAFIPEGRLEEKNRFERIDYKKFIRELKCIACGDKMVDYKIIEDFVFAIEEKYQCNVISIGYDRYNALSSAQKWGDKYATVEIKQHSSVLHQPTKLLFEKIISEDFKYETNTLLEINFQNARCTFDTNLNRYVNKKKSNGKVDMVVALINAIFLLQQDVIFNDGDFIAQVF